MATVKYAAALRRWHTAKARQQRAKTPPVPILTLGKRDRWAAPAPVMAAGRWM